MLPDQNGGIQPQDPVLTTGPLSLETESPVYMASSSTIDVINRAAKKRRIVWMIIAGMATLALFTMVSLIVTRANDTKNTQKSKATAYAATSIPLGDIADKAQVNLGQISQMQVNGTLQINGSLILPVSQVPENAKEGQVYYDKGTGKVYYYNGQEFKAVAAVGDGVTSISGLKGDIVLGQGFNVTNGTINVTPQTAQGTTGVTSFQGQSGSVVLTPGAGIIINGTTIANGGVTSIGGLTGALLPGRGLGVVSGQLTNTVTLTSGSATLTVTDDGNGNYTISQVGVGAGGTVALGPVTAQTDNSNNPSLYIDKTGTGNLLHVMVNGVDTFVVDQSGVIISGTIPYANVSGRPATTVQSIGGSNGTISLGAGLTMVGNVLSNTGTGISGVNGTVNQVNASTVAGVVTLSLPQNIATTSTPTFAGLNLTSPLGVGAGGTGQTSITTGDILVGSAGNNLSKLAVGGLNTCLISNGTTAVWGSCLAGGGGFTSLTLAASSGTPQTITNTGTITIAAGTNINTTAGSTGTVTVSTVNNPSFSGLVTASNGLTVSGGNLVVSGGTINTATITGGSLTGGSVSGGSLNTTSVNGVATADIVVTTGLYADPAWITTLAKSKVGLSNVENTALSSWLGSTNISTLGTITTGTWTGSVIGDTYVANNLTIDNSGSVDWVALNNYPAACAAGSAITALGDTVTCAAFAAGSGSGNYVQIQGVTPGIAQAGNFNIVGTAIAGAFSGNGAALTNLNASAISSGTIGDT